MTDDAIRIDYDTETGQITLEWDPSDPKWNWLGDLTEEEVSDMISKNLQEMLNESES